MCARIQNPLLTQMAAQHVKIVETMPSTWFQNPLDRSGHMDSSPQELTVRLSPAASATLRTTLLTVLRGTDASAFSDAAVAAAFDQSVVVLPVRFDGAPLSTFDAPSHSMQPVPPQRFAVSRPCLTAWMRCLHGGRGSGGVPDELALLVTRKDFPLSSIANGAPLRIAVNVAGSVAVTNEFTAQARQLSGAGLKAKKPRAAVVLSDDQRSLVHHAMATALAVCGGVAASTASAGAATAPATSLKRSSARAGGSSSGRAAKAIRTSGDHSVASQSRSEPSETTSEVPIPAPDSPPAKPVARAHPAMAPSAAVEAIPLPTVPAPVPVLRTFSSVLADLSSSDVFAADLGLLTGGGCGGAGVGINGGGGGISADWDLLPPLPYGEEFDL